MTNYKLRRIIDHIGGPEVAVDNILDLDTLTLKGKPSVNITGATSPFAMFGVHMKHQVRMQVSE